MGAQYLCQLQPRYHGGPRMALESKVGVCSSHCSCLAIDACVDPLNAAVIVKATLQ